MIILTCSIITLVLGFCAGSMRSLETLELKRLNKLYWETKVEYDECHEEKEMLKYEITKVKLELAKLKKQNSVVR